MPQINPRLLADAIRLGDSTYELILPNWGNLGKRADATSQQYPAARTSVRGTFPIDLTALVGEPIPSLFGIAISPRSTVDRCCLQLAQPQISVPRVGAGGVTFTSLGGIPASEQVLSINSPLIGQQPGPIVLYAHPYGWFSDDYIQAGVNAPPAPFGTALLDNPATNLVWTNPELRVLLYLNSRGVLPPTVRAPLHLTYEFGNANAGTYLTKVVPIMGRKRVRVAVQSYITGFGVIPLPVATGVTVNLSGTYHLATRNNLDPTAVLQTNHEVPLSSTPLVVAPGALADTNPSALIDVGINDPNLAYLLIKVTAVGGSFDLFFSVDGTD